MTNAGVTIDLFSSDSYASGHPIAQYAALRAQPGLVWHPLGDSGFWPLTRYQELRQVSRDSRGYTSTEGIWMWETDPGTLASARRMMLLMDPPEHEWHRRLVSPAFTPKAVAGLEHQAADIARIIFDELAPRGEGDLVADATGRMPSYFIADLIGFPRDYAVELFDTLSIGQAGGDVVTEEQRTQAREKLFEFFATLAKEKRERPADDLASRVLSAEVNGKGLDEEQFASFIWLLLGAGSDTVRNAMGAAMTFFLEEPAVWMDLRNNLDVVLPTAIEEILRWSSPVTHMARVALTDTTIDGHPIKAGDRVVMFYGAANRDPDVFDDPETFDIRREPNPHVAFGSKGIHICIGAYLARMEMRALLRGFATRLSNIELAGDVVWNRSNYIIGPESIPVTFTPA